MGGTLQTGDGTDNEFSDGRKSLHPDNSKRRTVYLPLRRSNLATLLTLFDFGDGATSTEIRAQTNVAPQALFMMNSKFVAERSRALARIAVEAGRRGSSTHQSCLVQILGREPSSEENEASLAYVMHSRQEPPMITLVCLPGPVSASTLIASNDFIYVH